jgi:hypothetical protein
VEDHHVALADFDALLLGDRLDLLAVECGALLDDIGAVVRSHVEENTAGNQRRDLLHAEFLETGSIGEIGILVAVVVDILHANVAEAIDLAADPDPAVDDIVVVGRLAWAEPGNARLPRLHDGDLEGTRRIGRRLGVGFDAEMVGLADLDQLGRLHNQVGRDVIGRADLVVGAPLGLGPVLRCGRASELGQGERCKESKQTCLPGHGDLPVGWSCGGPPPALADADPSPKV